MARSSSSGMSRAAWAPEERAEYEALLVEVVDATADTTERLNLYEQKIDDAVQAQRAWAREVLRGNQRIGARAEIKRFQDRTRALVSYDGRVLNLPAYQGTTTRSMDGVVVYQRELIEACSWEQIAAKRMEEILMRRVYDDRIAYLDKLLALRDRCPESVSPEDAADKMGIKLEEYLGDVGGQAA